MPKLTVVSIGKQVNIGKNELTGFNMQARVKWENEGKQDGGNKDKHEYRVANMKTRVNIGKHE